MKDGERTKELRGIAEEEMHRRKAKHACYGVLYDDIEDLSEYPDEIKYFQTSEDFYVWIAQRREYYASFGIEDVAFYAVHARC